MDDKGTNSKKTPADKAAASTPPAASQSSGQRLGGAVEVQQRQAAGRAAQVVDARHRLLTAVAALVQMGAEQADLVGNGVGVGIDEDPRHPRGNAVRVEGPDLGGPALAVDRKSVV